MQQNSKQSRVDGIQTKQKLLDVATQLFDQYGFAGATSKEICKKANTDLSAINYHFESRTNLYQTILKTGHEHFISLEFLENLQKLPLKPQKKLQTFFREIVRNLHSANSWKARIFAREVLTPTPYFAELITSIVMPKFKILRCIVAGILKIDAEDKNNNDLLLRCVANVIAPCLMILVSSSNASTPMQSLLTQNSRVLANHLYSFALAGLDAILVQN